MHSPSTSQFRNVKSNWITAAVSRLLWISLRSGASELARYSPCATPESVRRIENEIELSRRLAAIGRLTSGVAHEVKNPINAIVVHLELLREKMREDRS